MEDKKIIDLYLRRDESAITQSKTKYSIYLRTIAFNILKSNEDTDECENDTYLCAWNAIPPQVPLNLKLFLARIIRNNSISCYRKHHAEKRGGGMDMLLSELEECCPLGIPSAQSVTSASTEATPELALSAGELAGHLNSFLHAQPKEKRIMFVKRYWYGESITDISAEMSCTESKVSTTLFRMRADLKEKLEKEGIHV